jgi:hypothetical protein
VTRFQPGQWVELREAWDGRTWELRRGLVVRDDDATVVVYTPPSTPALIAAAEGDDTRLRLPPTDWRMIESATPADRRILAVHPLGAQHSVLAIWDEHWTMLDWYINLESDLGRTEAGFEYTDHFLDVIVGLDLTTWHWKDEDELAEALERGLVTAEQCAAFRAEGERALEWLIARRPPYDEPWEDWRPPESWR